ncbi:MAG TPA: hypothetical protein VN813_03750, partial [Luteibacter sp.]|nr:hypothetical protein [Luteibacter sp.]
LEPIYRDTKTAVFQMPHAYPRVLTPSRAELIPMGQSLSPASFATPDFASTVLLTPRDANDAATAATDATRCTGQVAIRSTASTNIQTTVQTAASSAGWLVITDQDFPGWITRVDGRETGHHRADGLLRAVCVPAGEHTVTFRYEPWRMVAQVLESEASWQ